MYRCVLEYRNAEIGWLYKWLRVSVRRLPRASVLVAWFFTAVTDRCKSVGGIRCGGSRCVFIR